MTLPDPRANLRRVARVDDQSVDVVTVAVDEDVVENAAGVVAHQAVADLSDGEVVHSARYEMAEDSRRVGPCELQPPHVRNVEQPGGFADGVMLVHDAGVLHRHLPAAELNDAAVVRGVPVIEGRAEQMFTRVIHG